MKEKTAVLHEKSVDYDEFLKVLNLSKGIHNSLNEMLKYDFIYHSNKIEGSTFTIETLQMLFEKNMVIGTHTLDDIQETINSFDTFDLVIDSIGKELTLDMIKEWHSSLMYRTRLYDLGLTGVFKKYQNEVFGANLKTASPWEVEDKLNKLIQEYYSLKSITIEDIAKFHWEFEIIHPFQDGNGRIGRFIYLKQVLDNRLELRYMNGETSSEYKKALATLTSDNIRPLVKYIDKQKDFIYESKKMYKGIGVSNKVGKNTHSSKHKPNQYLYEIWSEGFHVMEGHCKAILHGKSVGSNFKEACNNLAEDDKEFAQSYDCNRMTWWGCKLFDNEQEARKSFG